MLLIVILNFIHYDISVVSIEVLIKYVFQTKGSPLYGRISISKSEGGKA